MGEEIDSLSIHDLITIRSYVADRLGNLTLDKDVCKKLKLLLKRVDDRLDERLITL